MNQLVGLALTVITQCDALGGRGDSGKAMVLHVLDVNQVGGAAGVDENGGVMAVEGSSEYIQAGRGWLMLYRMAMGVGVHVTVSKGSESVLCDDVRCPCVVWPSDSRRRVARHWAYSFSCSLSSC